MAKQGHCNWEIIAYAESLKPTFVSILTTNFCVGVVSPLHDRDIWNEEDPEVQCGKYQALEAKKAHYHIYLTFRGARSFESVRALSAELSLNNEPYRIKEVQDFYAAVRYSIHYGRRDKAKYASEDIIPLNGYDIAAAFKPSKEQEDFLCYDILDYIEENNIFRYRELMQKLLDWRTDPDTEEYRDHMEMCSYVKRHTIFFNSYLKDRREYFFEYSDKKLSQREKEVEKRQSELDQRERELDDRLKLNAAIFDDV